jgi:hypothetical protein
MSHIATLINTDQYGRGPNYALCTLKYLIKIIVIGYDTKGTKTMGGYDSTRDGVKWESKGNPMSFVYFNASLPSNPPLTY